MKNRLIAELEKLLPKSMLLPEEIKLLYQWIEQHQLYVDIDDNRIGFLFPEKDLHESWSESGRKGGTLIQFKAEGSKDLEAWLSKADPAEIQQRLCVFARSGADGSKCAFWLSDQNELKIVHLGSGSGSLLFCVLADNAVDFLRLLAIGYDEICWDENFAYAPNELDDDFTVEANVAFQQWVKTTFQVDIPNHALQIVPHPTGMDDEHSQDEFFNWAQQYFQ